MSKTNTSETLTPESAEADEKVEGILAIIRNCGPRSDDERLWLLQLYKTLAPDADGPTVRAVGHHVIGVLKLVDEALAEMPQFPIGGRL